MGNAISNLFKNPKYPGAALNTDRPERARLYAKLGNILMPGEMRQRRAKTKEIAPLAPHTIPEQDGYLILPPVQWRSRKGLWRRVWTWFRRQT